MTKSNEKKKKGKDKAEAPAHEGDQAVNGSDGGQIDEQQLKQIQKAMDLLQLRQAAAFPPEVTDAQTKKFEFWNTQPVPKMDEEVTSNEAINEDIPIDKLRQEPYSLPTGFTWDNLNLNDPLVLKELYVLLNENYVEDDDNMFRFDYSPEFLRWALQPPGYKLEWHCGVRSAAKTKKLLGFISAVPAKIRVHGQENTMVEINFLCVHKKLRSKRLAPVLIREITRRVNCQGIFQAVYTAGVVLPKPVGTCRYWHRSLNPKKLVEVQFSHLSRTMTMQRHIKLYRLPEETKTSGLRKLKSTDISAACELLNKFLSSFKLTPVFSEEDFKHWFTPRENIVECFVVEEPGTGKITDLFSFYCLPSTVMNHPTHKSIKAAYAFYNVSTKTAWPDLISDALILAKKANFDVFNALDLMENESFLEKLKFGIGDGNLQYYLYNWKCPSMVPKEIGLVLQ